MHAPVVTSASLSAMWQGCCVSAVCCGVSKLLWLQGLTVMPPIPLNFMQRVGPAVLTVRTLLGMATRHAMCHTAMAPWWPEGVLDSLCIRALLCVAGACVAGDGFAVPSAPPR
jgi:hypothetical protein